MAQVPTIEIVSLKDPNERWIINQADYDPAKHTLWEQRPEQSLGIEKDTAVYGMSGRPGDSGMKKRKE